MPDVHCSRGPLTGTTSAHARGGERGPLLCRRPEGAVECQVKRMPLVSAPGHPHIAANVLEEGVAPGAKSAGGRRRGTLGVTSGAGAGARPRSHLLAAAGLRTCASAQLARSCQARTRRRPAASPGSRAWSPVPGFWSWQAQGWEQALPRTGTGMDSPFPCPQDFISPCHQTPCGTDIPTPLFAAECVTKGARGARAPRPVGSRHSGLRFRFRAAAAGCQARGPRGAARLPQRGGRREQSACARGWAGPKAKETA